MKILHKLFLMTVLQLPLVAVVSAQNYIIQDDGVDISDLEFEYLVTRWTKQMRDVAVADEGDRLELINLSLANKKVARLADKVAAENPEVRWKYQLGLEAYQREFVLRQYRDSLEVPDFTELAKERYTVNRETMAVIPEKRMSSHILFITKAGMPIADREKITVEAQTVLDQLRAGADFAEMVTKYSEEPGAAEREGKFDRWMQFGEMGVSPPYSEGVFSITKIGDYSELVQTQFGLHIIRLDGIQEKSYKPYEEVKDAIIKELEAEFLQLSMKEYVGRFNITDDAVIDSDAVEAILAPYAPQK